MNTLRKKIKLAVCYIIYHTGLLNFYLKRLFLKGKNFPAVVINYHSFVKDLDGVIETHPSVSHLIDDFKEEVQFLKSNFILSSAPHCFGHLWSIAFIGLMTGSVPGLCLSGPFGSSGLLAHSLCRNSKLALISF